jgi:hypothetical protein
MSGEPKEEIMTTYKTMPVPLLQLLTKWGVTIPRAKHVKWALDDARWANNLQSRGEICPDFVSRYAENRHLNHEPLLVTMKAIDAFQQDNRFWEEVDSPRFTRRPHGLWHYIVSSLLDVARGLDDETAADVEFNSYYRNTLVLLAQEAQTDGSGYFGNLSSSIAPIAMYRPTPDSPDFWDYLSFGAAMFDVMLDRHRVKPVWFGEMLDEGFEAFLHHVGPKMAHYAAIAYPVEAVISVMEAPILLEDRTYLDDAVELNLHWRRMGSVISETGDHVEQLLCSLLSEKLKRFEPECAPAVGGLRKAVIDTDLNIRRFCERVSARYPSYSNFGQSIAKYDRRLRSAGPLLPEAFLADIDEKARAYSEFTKSRKQKRGGRRSPVKTAARDQGDVR